MISEDVIKQLADSAETHGRHAAIFQGWLDSDGDTPTGSRSQMVRATEALAVEYNQIVEVCELLNADERFRTAYADAQARQSTPDLVAHSTTYWDRVAAAFRERHGATSATGLTPEQCERLVEIANEMRGEGHPCHECTEPAHVFREDRWLCEPCDDVANAVNLVPIDPRIGSGELAWDVQEHGEDDEDWTASRLDYDVFGWEPDVLAALMAATLAECLSSRPELTYYGKTARVRVWDAARGADTARVAVIGVPACIECGEPGEFKGEDGWFCEPHAGGQSGPTDPQEQADAMADVEVAYEAWLEGEYSAGRLLGDTNPDDAAPLDASDAEAAEVEIL